MAPRISRNGMISREQQNAQLPPQDRLPPVGHIAVPVSSSTWFDPPRPASHQPILPKQTSKVQQDHKESQQASHSPFDQSEKRKLHIQTQIYYPYGGPSTPTAAVATSEILPSVRRSQYMTSTIRIHPPQAFISTYAPRLRQYGNALITPVAPSTNQIPNVRTTKRGTTAINYAEDGYDDDDFDVDSEGPSRRPTGLRSLRRQEDTNASENEKSKEVGKEIDRPVDVQGIWREWMGKPSKLITEKQHQAQCALPTTLIPVRIDLEIPSFRPEAALPAPSNARDFGIDESQPAYRAGEPTPAYRLKDFFLWNLHEALTTPDQFARRFVEELDLPIEKRGSFVMNIAQQIRTQLEEYAGVAMHPLFQPAQEDTLSRRNRNAANHSKRQTPAPRNASQQPTTNGHIVQPTVNGQTNNMTSTSSTSTSYLPNGDGTVTASASTLPLESNHDRPQFDHQPNGNSNHAEPGEEEPIPPLYDPDPTHRCIINLTLNLRSHLLTDRFEWSLLHPPGIAELFAKQTAADMGLGMEWVSAIAHSIYEAVLRLKKEVCENGGFVLGLGGGVVGEHIDNECLFGAEAGLRYDPETLGEGWEPRLEVLSKEEIEKREGDRERQLRRARRETARISTTNVSFDPPETSRASGYFDIDGGGEQQALGRGERSKKKRKFRSLSPLGRDTPDNASGAGSGYGGLGGSLHDSERQYFRCSNCHIWGMAVWAVRDGPSGPRTLCHNCGFLYERDRKLPLWLKDLWGGEGYSSSTAITSSSQQGRRNV